MCTPHREHTNIFHAVRGRPSSHGHAVESARSKLCADRPPYTQICEQRGPFAQVNCEWTYSSCGHPSASASFHRVVRLAWRTRAPGPSASRSCPSSSPPKSFGALDDARPVSSHQPHRAVSATNPCSTPPEHAHDASHLSPARKHRLTAARMSSPLVRGRCAHEGVNDRRRDLPW